MAHAAWSIVLVAALALGLRAEAQTVPLELSHPDGPDLAEIEYQANSCFNAWAATLSIFRGPRSLRVWIRGETEAHWSALSEEDLRGIDALFVHYRSGWKSSTRCTSWTAIRVSWYRGGDLVGSESFRTSCGDVPSSLDHLDHLSPEQRASLVSIRDLMARLSTAD